jgi:hypothetical protein
MKLARHMCQAELIFSPCRKHKTDLGCYRADQQEHCFKAVTAAQGKRERSAEGLT